MFSPALRWQIGWLASMAVSTTGLISDQHFIPKTVAESGHSRSRSCSCSRSCLRTRSCSCSYSRSRSRSRSRLRSRSLQPLTGVSFSHRTAICHEGARLDVCAHGFWGDRHQRAFFYVRVQFNPLAPSNCRFSLAATYIDSMSQLSEGATNNVFVK